MDLNVAPASTNTRIQAALHTDKNIKEVREAAQKFEGMFMNEMLSHMFAGVEVDSQFGGGKGEEVFRSMMIEQYGTIIAKSGQTGLSSQLEKQMLKMQEEQLDPRNSPKFKA